MCMCVLLLLLLTLTNISNPNMSSMPIIDELPLSMGDDFLSLLLLLLSAGCSFTAWLMRSTSESKHRL